MPADSLVEMARRSCSRYSRSIVDIGYCPYELIRPVLLKIESPEQLHQLEQNCPQIIGKDSEIWLNLIKRDIPDWENKRHEPRDAKNWWKVYRKLKQEAVLDMAAGEDKLKAALNNIQNEKAQHVAQLVTRNDLPRQQVGKHQRIAYNYLSGKTGSKGASKMTLMEKIRKEARSSKGLRRRPVQEIPKRSSLITKAPQQFVEELRQKALVQASHLQTGSPDRIRAPRPPMHAASASRPPISSYNLMQDREARLKALKSGAAIGSHGPSSSTPEKSRTIPTQEEGGTPRKQPTPKAGLSPGFLEDLDEDPDPGKHLGVPTDRPRMTSPMRISSPQPRTMKRKAPPTLFMSTPKKVARRPEVT